MEDIKMMAVGNEIRKMRLLNGDLTQQELANQIGCSRQTIHSIESGKFLPSVELALKMAKVLNLRVEDLFYLGSQK